MSAQSLWESAFWTAVTVMWIGFVKKSIKDHNRGKDLVSTGEAISLEYGIPIVNKRISVTPVALVGASCCKTPEDFVKIGQTLDRAAKSVGR